MNSSAEATALAARVVATLRRRSQTIATAESLTGGLVGATITGVPGASAVYRGGLITYATELKATLAGVASSVLATDGPVATTTAAQLAQGAARACGADWGVATTGVAGPNDQDGHPVGQVFVAVAGPFDEGGPFGEGGPFDEGEPFGGDGPLGGDGVTWAAGVTVRELALRGDRAEIRAQTVSAALQLVTAMLDRTRGAGG